MIAAYQAADVIGDAIDSALSQTVPPSEVVICDDGSTDDLKASLAPYRSRILLLRKENGGEASAKNAAARAATGDFVVILDADDVFLPECLEALGELASARPDLDLLTTDAYLEMDGRRLRRCYRPDWPFEVDDQRRGILERNFVFGLAAVRRSVLLAAGGFDEAIRWTTDWECWIRLILSGARVGLVAEPLARYRLREASLSADRASLAAGRVQTLTKTLSHPELGPAEQAVVRRSLRREERELALLRLRRSLRERRPDARRRALTVALGEGFPAGTRAKAAASALAPGTIGRVLEARHAAAWQGAAGTHVARDAADLESAESR